MSNIKVTVQDANNVLLEVTPVPIQQIAISRGVAGRGIDDVQAIEIDNALYLEFFFTDGTTEIVGPVGTIQYIGESPIVVDAATISLSTVPVTLGGTGQITANAGFNALAPSQTGNAGKYLTTDGSNTSWANNPLGTVTSVDMTVPTGLTVSGNPITTSGTLAVALQSGYSIPTTASQTNWDTAYSERQQWNGGATNLVAATGRTSLGLGTIATQDASAVAITGGSITGITDLAVADGGTGASTAAGAMVNLLPSYTGNANKRLSLDSTASGLEWVTDGGGTVTSVDVSGGTTGLSFTGGPITTSGTITLSGTLDVDNGGTGATTAAGARTNLNAADQALTLTAGTGLSGGGDLTANRSFSIANTGVTAASYGAASKTLTATVNAQGQLTALADTDIAISNTQISGLGTMSTQNANAVAITGGSITGITDLAVADGGTGASDATGARTNLGAAASATTISAGTGLSGGGDLTANRTLSIANTAVTAGSYGTASDTLTATVNAQGQLTALAATPIAISNTQISGLGTMSTQNSNAVTITGGSITGITDLAIADGGTGASTASGARSNLGLGTAAVLDAGVANGVATLDAGGTVPLSQIPASIQGGVSYQGAWNASTNTPTLTSSVGTKGHYYVVSVAGNTNLNGVTDWLVGDWAIYNGTAWEKIDNTDQVASVNGYTGVVVLTNTDVGAPPTSLTISAGTGLSGGGDLTTNRTLSIANTAVSAGSYGTASAVPSFTVNGQGQLTAASDVTIAISNAQVSGLGTMSTQNANSVAITGGSITGITDLAIADGGTGASNAADARANLGVTATGGDTTYLFRANNLSDLANAATARTNLGLGTAATQDSTAFATAAQGAKADTAIQTITSTDGSIVVTPAGTTINLAVSEASPASTLLTAVRNTTGATLTKGTVVYISGATGQIATVSKAIATGDATSAQTLGMITSDLANNSNGYVTVFGLLEDIDTSSYTDGAQLYLSGTTAGAVTATKPSAPTHLVYVAVVEYAHPTQGKLLVKVQNGYELDEIHDVSIVSPTTGQTLVYSASTDLWSNSNAPVISGTTINNTTIGATTASSGAFTTLSASSDVTLSGGTANGVLYLNGSKQASSGSALTFDGTNLTTNAIKAGGNSGDVLFGRYDATYPTSGIGFFKLGTNNYDGDTGGFTLSTLDNGTLRTSYQVVETSGSASYHTWYASGSEQMRLTSTSLYTASGISVGIGTNNPSSILTVAVDDSTGTLGPRVVGVTDPNKQLRLSYNTTDNYANIQAIQVGTAYTNLVLQKDGGNVGIGTSSLNATYAPRLQVESNATDGTGGLLIGNYLPTLTLIDYSGGAGASQIQQDGTNFLIKNGGTTRITIDSAGNILKQYGTEYQSYTSGGSISHMMSYQTWGGQGNLLVVGNTFDGIVFGTGGGTMTEKGRFTASGRFGVGTNDPSATVHVNGGDGTTGNEYNTFYVSNASNSSKRVAITYDTANDTGIIAAVHAGTAWKNLSIPYGQLGIGTPTPESKLAVKGSSGDSDLFSISDIGVPTSGAEYGVAMIKSASTDYLLNITSYSANGKGLRIYHNGGTQSNYAFNVTSASGDRLIVDGLGNLGLGTNNPNAKLEVYVTRTSSTNATAIILSDNVTGAQTNGVYKSIQSRSNNGSSISEIRFVETDGTNNNTAIAFATAGTAGGLSEKMRVLNTGAILALAGATLNSSGTGIGFPTTQSASSDPNVLDDYEEGTFTPILSTDSGSYSITYTAQTGRYTKIGRIVQFQFYIAWSAFTGSGNVVLGGLPFNFRYRSGAIEEQGFPILYASQSALLGTAFGQDTPTNANTAYLWNFTRTGLVGTAGVGTGSNFISVTATGYTDT